MSATITATWNSVQIDELLRGLKNGQQAIGTVLQTMLNDTARSHEKQIKEKIKNQINIDQAEVDENIEVKRFASVQNLEAVINIKKTSRPSLKRFSPKQEAGGVSYEIQQGEGKKYNAGSKFIQGAFIGTARLGGHVYKRKGAARLPIVQLKGVSVWGVYVVNDMESWSVKLIEQELIIGSDDHIETISQKLLGNQ